MEVSKLVLDKTWMGKHLKLQNETGENRSLLNTFKTFTHLHFQARNISENEILRLSIQTVEHLFFEVLRQVIYVDRGIFGYQKIQNQGCEMVLSQHTCKDFQKKSTLCSLGAKKCYIFCSTYVQEQDLPHFSLLG